MVRLVCTGEGLSENIGSVSIPQFIILNGGLQTYSQYITLFEHEQDDEYDGEMGIQDVEDPMLLVTFDIRQEGADDESEEDKPEFVSKTQPILK